MKWNVVKHGKQRELKDEKKQTAALLRLEGQNALIECSGQTQTVQLDAQPHAITLTLSPQLEGKLIWNGKENGIWALRPPVYEEAEVRYGSEVFRLRCRGVRCQILKQDHVIGWIQPNQIESDEPDPLLAAFLILVHCRMIEEKDCLLV